MYWSLGLGSCAYTVPMILSATVKALHTFMQLARDKTVTQRSSSNHHAPDTSNIAFTSTHLHAILHSYHLCHLIESFILLPPPPAILLPTVKECVARLHDVYEASLDAGVYSVVPLVCAYVWRIRSVVDSVSASEEAGTVLQYVRSERKKQREAEVKQEDDTML